MQQSSSNNSIISATSGKQEQHQQQQPPALEPTKHAKRVTFGKQQRKPLEPQTTIRETEVQTGLTSCLITTTNNAQRIEAGANNPAERKVGWLARTDSECQFRAPGLNFLNDRDTNVVTFEVKMRDSVQSLKNFTTKCDYFPKYVDNRPFKDQATQTLYRESSAQTVAYLPDILDKEQDENLELFNLSSLLAGDKPPGLYEVEVLERARKRWAFNKALKTNFKRQLHEAREQAIKSKYRPVLEAFEWEHWMEREEYIQECQMMRLEIVIRMFDKREKQMHKDSITRIETACEDIEKKRLHGLHKNEIEYQRAIRRLQWKQAGTTRRWKKQSPGYSLGSPCSEFYGPLLRNGVDPARRSFVGDGRKAFDMRIDDLEKRVNMQQLQCPFTKLKEWSKPKEYVKEYEQNFCSDKHLQKLYESLKGLRTQATKQKVAPKCLKRRPQPVDDTDMHAFDFDYTEPDMIAYFDRRTHYAMSSTQLGPSQSQLLAIRAHENEMAEHAHTTEKAEEMWRERHNEDLEQMLHLYEGSAIGWLLQFLSEEMERLKEQRKLHFFAILAQKERWRREAAEAGLRQKENNMRLLYEEMFQSTNLVHNDVTDEYINTILTTDMAHIADCDAEQSVVKLAKQIDNDIQRWLETFKLVQNPLTYEPLRHLLYDMVFPDFNAALAHHEKNLIAKYIIDDVIFENIWDILEPFDIGTTLASDLIDRLIDNDLLLFSTDSEDDQPHRSGWYEAQAIIRKLIRQAVPGRRWKTENERIVHENYNDLFDDVFAAIFRKIEGELPPEEPKEVSQNWSRMHITSQDNTRHDPALDEHRLTASSLIDSDFIREQILNLFKKMKTDKITKDLGPTGPAFDGEDNLGKEVNNDVLINVQTYHEVPMSQPPEVDDIFSVISTLDIQMEDDFSQLRSRNKMETPAPGSIDTPGTDIGVDFGVGATQTTAVDQLMGALKDIVFSEGEEATEASEYEADDERSWWAHPANAAVFEDEGELGEEQIGSEEEIELEFDFEISPSEQQKKLDAHDEQLKLLEQEQQAAETATVIVEPTELIDAESVHVKVKQSQSQSQSINLSAQISREKPSTLSLLESQRPSDRLAVEKASSQYFSTRLDSKNTLGTVSNYDLSRPIEVEISNADIPKRNQSEFLTKETEEHRE
ncbi:CG15145 [Drosophila busckii]|uniref:Cilia- and flagella-associated protein 91 n=2 Tax=Drosophila busckii TaxID=30019 RepID=A0A0M4E4B6_DROBS|nr:CG15145 [Drosophila busckii]